MTVALALLTVGLVIGFYVAVVVAAFSTRYMWRIYNRSKKPRSWFFRMMLNSSFLKVVCGAIVGYQTSSFLINPLLAPLHIEVPRLPSEISAPLLLIVAIALVSPPSYYANTIRLVRRRGIYDPEILLAERTAVSPSRQAAHADPEHIGSSRNDVMPHEGVVATPYDEDLPTGERTSGGPVVGNENDQLKTPAEEDADMAEVASNEDEPAKSGSGAGRGEGDLPKRGSVEPDKKG